MENERETAQGWRKRRRVIWIGWNDEKGNHKSFGKETPDLCQPNTSQTTSFPKAFLLLI